MKKLLYNPAALTGGYILLAIIVGILITTGLTRRILDTAQYQSEDTALIHKDQVVRQSIRPINHGLNTILIYLKNSAFSNRDSFRFRLLDANSQKVREVDINGTNIGEADNVRFQFAPIVDSAGQFYIIELMSDTLSHQATIKAGVSASDGYSQGRLLSPDLPNSDLSFQLYYQPQDKRLLLEGIGRYISKRMVNFQFVGLAAMTTTAGFLMLKKILMDTNLK
jgi:hypothetical protein